MIPVFTKWQELKGKICVTVGPKGFESTFTRTKEVYSIRILKEFKRLFLLKISYDIQSRLLNDKNKSCDIQSTLLGLFKEYNKIRWYSIKIFHNI